MARAPRCGPKRRPTMEETPRCLANCRPTNASTPRADAIVDRQTRRHRVLTQLSADKRVRTGVWICGRRSRGVCTGVLRNCWPTNASAPGFGAVVAGSGVSAPGCYAIVGRQTRPHRGLELWSPVPGCRHPGLARYGLDPTSSTASSFCAAFQDRDDWGLFMLATLAACRLPLPARQRALVYAHFLRSRR